MKRWKAVPEGGEGADGVRADPASPERAELTSEDFLVGAGVAGVGLYVAASRGRRGRPT